MQTVNKATVEGPLQTIAQVYRLQFAGGKLACFVEANTNVLSHYASGRMICRLPIAKLGKERRRPLCQGTLDRHVARLGVDVVREALRNAPTINP